MKEFKAFLKESKEVEKYQKKVQDIKAQMHKIQDKYKNVGSKFALWGTADQDTLTKKEFSDSDYKKWHALGKEYDKYSKKLSKAKSAIKPAARAVRDNKPLGGYDKKSNRSYSE